MDGGIQGLELDSGVPGGETPVGTNCVAVSLSLPGLSFVFQDVLAGNPAVQTLARQRCQFHLGHIQPTPVPGRVVDFQPFRNAPPPQAQMPRTATLGDGCSDCPSPGLSGPCPGSPRPPVAAPPGPSPPWCAGLSPPPDATLPGARTA